MSAISVPREKTRALTRAYVSTRTAYPGYVRIYIHPHAEERSARGRAREGATRFDGRVAAGWLKRDREHSDWPIVVQRSDNASNWPSLDKTAK